MIKENAPAPTPQDSNPKGLVERLVGLSYGTKFRLLGRPQGAPTYTMLGDCGWKRGIKVRREWPDGYSDETYLSKKTSREMVDVIKPNDRREQSQPGSRSATQ